MVLLAELSSMPDTVRALPDDFAPQSLTSPVDGLSSVDRVGGTIVAMTLATDGPEPHARRRVPTPWGEGAGRVDATIGLLIGLCAAYSLVLWPLTPALIGSHPLLLEMISGSTLAEVTVGAHSRLGELPLWFAVAAGVPASMMFDWVFWWAGRRWGDRALHLVLGSDPSPRGVARREARAARLERMALRFGPVAVVLAYYLPLPSLLIYVAAGLSGMRLRTFLALDVVGTLLWVGPIVGLGYAVGEPAVDVVHTIDHYSMLLIVVAVLGVIVVQAQRRWSVAGR
jgi:membrane-associated protein